MSIIISDSHGNYQKIKCFLEYKPEEEHIYAGDIFDSFHASDEIITQCFWTLVNSDCILLWGNHDLHYLNDAPFTCTGFRNYGSMKYTEENSRLINYYTNMIEKNINRFKASMIVDNFIITHAGVHKAIAKNFNTLEDLDLYLNNEMNNYLKNRTQKFLSQIFNVGHARHGRSDFGGIFWADFRHEQLCKKINQIFGHSCIEKPKIIKNKSKNYNTIHVCIDSPKFICFNTKTLELENFFPDEEILNRDYLERQF
jgi:predicted phosphodiesterase